MGYKLKLRLDYKKTGEARNTSVEKMEEKMCSVMDGEEWEYKTLKGLENRVRFLLNSGSKGIDKTADNNTIVIASNAQGGLKVVKRLPNYPSQFVREGSIEALMEALENDRDFEKTVPLNFFYEKEIERYRGCYLLIKDTKGEEKEINTPEIVDRVTKTIYKIWEREGKFPGIRRVKKVMGTYCRQETEALIEEVYQGIREGEGM